MTVERAERASEIMTRLTDDGTLSVSALAVELGVSEVTIRGDLRNLEERGLLVRTRGGARPTTLKSILQREKLHVEAKQRIAAAAAAMVLDDDTIMIEAGTTTAMLVRNLTGRRGVQIVTNSALAFSTARINPALGVILTGANDDGARGLQAVVEAGGVAIVEDPAEAYASAMPAASLRASPSAKAMKVAAIASYVSSLGTS